MVPTRRKLIGDPGASERAYRTRVVADRQKALNMMKVPHDRLERNADVSNRDPLPKAQQTRQTVNLQLCCEFNSWQICGACNSAQRSHTCGHAQDSVAMGEQVNLHLLPQGLTRSILEAICPVQANFGPLLESKDQFGRGNGYRFHSSMVTFSWHCRSIEDRVAGLFPAERIVAEAALEPDDKAAKRWLRYIEKEGLECVLWPHLFTQRKQCLTWARLQSTTRQAKAAHRSTLAERLDAPLLEEDEEAEPPADVVGVKRHYMALLFSPILDVGLSYEILHFSYDLNLWSDLGSKRNLQLGLPMRLMLKNHSFSSEYWKAKALGCRVLRLRKLCGTGHPSLSWDAEERRCSNAAFCTRRVESLDYTGNEGKSYCCTKCKSAYYCSKLCQSSHFVAHQFECKSLRQLRLAAQNLRSMEPRQLRVTLAEVLEELLAKQVSSQSHLEATTLCHSVHESLTGQNHGAPESLEIGSKEVALPALPTHVLHRGARDRGDWGNGGAMSESRLGSASDFDVRTGTEGKKEVQIAGNCVVLLPQEQFQWKVQKRKESDEPEMQVSEEELLKRRSRRMFSAQHSNVHTAVGIVRLMSRWANTSHSLQAIKEVTEDGLFFYLITGLCLTEHFAKRQMSPETMMAILSHRMALHVAASQDWSLVPMMRPPLELQEMGVSALDVAQYSAYYAFLKHRRLPFGDLRPLMPIIAMVWGNRARDALLALPYLLEPNDGAHPNRSTGRNGWRRGSRLGSFADVAREHFGEIQLVDSVQLDVYTGRAWFLLSDSVNVSAPTRLAGVETWILLLDASRGLQAVSCPVPASELRRCAL
ncbi:unnamed protein product [Cladocopium goreaui]|uniref:MYND-type domain-containing protein n=1 Tax=Cladocopium goreaui TaxID=2562237 RepID=A0A9P1DGD5_9DINO|nr:unnamed protein product [Cladocopium goreaui]